jgi:heme oxygenase (biliverdin-producing, ferredoxin)
MIADGLEASLSTSFRQRTSVLHSQAERSGVIQDMLRGRVTREGYALLLRNLLPAYQRLEAELERRRFLPVFQGVAHRAVYRAGAIKTVLSALYGRQWADMLPLLPAGRQYAHRIETVAGGDGTRLIAHVYTRYLGDLNGGQILKRLLSQSLGLESDALSFFDFPEIADMARFKTDYRNAIDQSAREIANIAPVIEEAATAFDLNIQVSEAVRQALLLGKSAREASGTDSPHRPAFGST